MFAKTLFINVYAETVGGISYHGRFIASAVIIMRANIVFLNFPMDAFLFLFVIVIEKTLMRLVVQTNRDNY